MLQRLTELFHDLQHKEKPDFAPDDHRVAAAALLVHIMTIDGAVDAAELHKLRLLLKNAFGLDEENLTALIAEAERRDREAVDLYAFTSLIKRALDEAGRLRIIEMLWEMTYADGVVHEFEDNAVSRIAELIGISPRERVTLRKKVEARLKKV